MSGPDRAPCAVGARRRSAASEQKAGAIVVTDQIRESARQVLPFKLTNGQRVALKEIVDDLQRAHPMNRIAEPEEMAEAVVFMASDRASYMTGHPLAVDGGFLAAGVMHAKPG